MTPDTHEALMVRFQQGDLQAFELLVELYRAPVFNFVYRMLGRNREAAEDLLQEIFMNAHGTRDRYEPQGRFAAWLFAIARNCCLNALKSRTYRQGRNTVPLDEAGYLRAAPDAAPGGQTTGPAQALAGRETAELLEQAISRLPAGYRDVFVLHAIEGFSHQDIAGMRQENPATVRSTYHRARRMLRKDIGPALAGEGSGS